MTPLLALLLAATPAAAPTAGEATTAARRFALVVAASDGGGDRLRLRHADDDARAFHRVLTELGDVAADDATLVLEPDHQGLVAALGRTARQLDAARAAGERTEVVFYYSGHSDEAGLLLAGERLGYVDLRRAVDAMAADLRVVVLDSCASGELTRAKGVVRRPAFLSEVGRVRGHAFLTSSAANESAQESDAIGASFFTYFLVTGLRGAADITGDQRVSLTEAYQFAFHETLARTERTTLGGQHPAYAMDIAGTGDVVLTDLSRAEATLVLPESAAGRFYVRDIDERLVAELKKPAGRATELALAAGAYTLLLDVNGDRLAAKLELAPGARVVLDETTLVRVPGEPVTARGPTPDELASRAAERERVAKRVYAREQLSVVPPGWPLSRDAFLAYAGTSTVPLTARDFFDRAGRPDLVQQYDDNLVKQAWLTWGGIGLVSIGTAALAAVALLALPPSAFFSAYGAFTIVTVTADVLAISGVLYNPSPVDLEGARRLARTHNERLQRELGAKSPPATAAPSSPPAAGGER